MNLSSVLKHTAYLFQKVCNNFRGGPQSSLPCSFFSTAPASSQQQVISDLQKKIQVGDTWINFATIGNGPQAVLCLPGLLGTIETDFEPILRRVDLSKFTLICWDPPGYGKSQLLAREEIYHGNPFANEADLATDLMRILDFENYSIMGWGQGGITGAHIAATYKKSVEKFICWGSWAKINERTLATASFMQDPKGWSTSRWNQLLDIYGPEQLNVLLTQHKRYVEKCMNNDYFRMELLLPAVKAPTLILHAEKDTICSEEDAKIYAKLIPKSTLETWSDATHSLHLDHPDKFVDRVEKFLTDGY